MRKRARNAVAAGLAGSKAQVFLRSTVFAWFVVVVSAFGALGQEDDAFARARKMGRGVNILGYDGIWEGKVNAPFKKEYFKLIRDAGFRHVRINLHGFKYMGRDYEIDRDVLERLDWVIGHASTTTWSRSSTSMTSMNASVTRRFARRSSSRFGPRSRSAMPGVTRASFSRS